MVENLPANATKVLGNHTRTQTRKLVGFNYLINRTIGNFFWLWGKITGLKMTKTLKTKNVWEVLSRTVEGLSELIENTF